MYIDGIFPVPDLQPGKLVFNKRKNGVYIQLVLKQGYDPVKKYGVSERISIGKLVDPNDRTRMYANFAYKKHFPDLMPLEPEQPKKRNAVVKVGGFIALEHIYTEQQVYPIMADSVTSYSGALLDMAFNFIISENNVCQHLESYGRTHPLHTEGMRIYSDTTYSRILAQHPEDDTLAFLEAWNNLQDHSQRIYVSYDSSNKASAGDIDLVAFGCAKIDTGSPIYNYSLVFNQTNQVPLFYELYNGAINDVKQLKHFVDKLKEHGYHNIGIILDRGYFSRENIEYMDAEGFNFLIMVKGCKKLVSGIVDEVRDSFELNSRFRVAGTNLYATTVERKLYDDDTSSRWFHICYSPEKFMTEHRDLLKRIDDLEAELKKNEGQEYIPTPECEEYFTLYYRQDGKRQVLAFAEKKHDAITATAKRCGFFCLISSAKMSAQEAYQLYSGRDSTEKLFLADKTFLGSHCARVHSTESLKTKSFAEFLALIGRNRMFVLLQDEMLRLNVKRNYMTVPAAIRELEQIMMFRVRETGRYTLANPLSKAQKEIFRALGMSEADVLARVKQLGEELDASFERE